MNQAEEARSKIAVHREKIDEIDELLIDLLNRRAEQSLAIRNLKPAAGMDLYDPKREGLILDRLAALGKGPLGDEDIREIYETLLKVMKAFKA